MTFEEQAYLVLINDELQYSLWPSDLEVPPGWRKEGYAGGKDECMAYIDETWTDMRPLSLRELDDKNLGDASSPDGSGFESSYS
ncbi:MbtH family protein [Xanthomonas albilineans]|uniref:MbtH-like protein n=1 Tax=Xanthomonas albilineans TaxID=29447 RepID=Q70C37_XANAL|nr:MbtH family NRPS accessory protein [Xanthomonas albilineans]CAE52329.1 MbtH-like protein [Xanthomonas albilineans]